MRRRRKPERAGNGGPLERTSQGNELRAAVLVVVLFFGVGLLIFGGVLAYSLVSRVGREAGPPKAAIVDQLSLTAPNPAFAQAATKELLLAGYTVDYYPGEQVTVDFFRTLPKRGYELIIARVHGARFQAAAGLTDHADLFTGEPFDRTKYTKERREGLLRLALLESDGSEDSSLRYGFFGITADFVRSSVRGGFDSATIILMGCDVLRAESLADAFVERGAGAVVGWDGPVSASHTDAATLNLLQHLVAEDVPVQEAAAAAMAEIGPDPHYDSVLVSYPPEG